jgi:PAS domain S-box-containing protein
MNKSSGISNRAFVQIAGAFVIVLGSVALIGWRLNNQTLKCIVPGSTPLKPNIAAGLLLCGAGLMLSSRKKIQKWPGHAITLIGLLIIAMALLTLGEHCFDWNVGIDHWLVREIPSTNGAVNPGRMLPTTAFCFVVMGVALLAETEWVPRRMGLPLGAGLSAALVMIGVLALGGFSLEKLIGPRWNLLGMSVSGITASVGFMVLGSGLLALRQSKGELTWSLNALTTVGFASGILLMVIAAAMSFNFTLRLQKTAVEVAQTQEILKEIEEVEVNLLDLESGQRGYIITGDQALLERKSAETEVQNHLGILRRLVSDDALQKLLLGRVESLIGQRIAWGDKAMLIRQQHGFLAAQEMMATGTGHALVKKCHQVFSDMEQAGYERLSRGQKQSEVTSQTAFLLLPLGMFLSLAILSLGLFFLNAGIGERARSEKALRQSEERMRAVLESALDCVITMDHEGRVVEFNPSAEKTFGYRRGEAIGRILAELIIPHSLRAAHTRGLSRYLATGEGPVLGKHIELTAMRGDGSEFPVELAITRIASQDPPLFTGFIRDITERKRGEEALRESEAQFRTMANSIPQLAWMAHPDGFIFWYNQRWHDYTGTTPEQMIGWGWQSVHHPDVLPKVLEKWRGAIAAGQPFEMEFPLRAANGTFRTFLTRGQPLKDSKGAVVQWFGTNTDVDELKRMEESLRDTQARLNSTLAAGSIGTWTWDIVNDRLVADEFTARMFSIEGSAAAKGLPAEAYLQGIDAGDRPGVVDALERAIQSCGQYDIEYRVRQRDGEFRWLQARGRVEGDEAGKALNFHGAVMDITERKQAEETAQRLREAEKEHQVAAEASRAKNEFLAMMSHELRTPLNAVIGFTGTLLMELPGPITPEQRKQLETIKSSGRHQLSLINDLLDLAKIESGRFHLKTEPIDCAKVIREVTDTLRPMAESKALRLCIDLPNEATTVQADNRALKQILINLVNNAIKFTDKGEVRIAICSRNGKTEIAVMDTGPGISAEDQAKLFKPFSRLYRSSGQEGTGLGLHLSRQLATLLDGEIVTESQPGKGSTFTLTLRSKEQA